MREKNREKGKERYGQLLKEQEKAYDAKRELEFELMQMEDRNDRLTQREQVRIDKVKQ